MSGKTNGWIYIFLFFPSAVFAQTDPVLRAKIMEETLMRQEGKLRYTEMLLNPQSTQPAALPIPTEKKSTPEINGYFYRPELSELYLTLGIQLGHINGSTKYDFDHHTSELKFPLNNDAIGGDFSFGTKNLSLNASIFATFEKDAGFEMTDKDWIGDILISSTKSRTEADAVIYDANLRYDFYNLILSKDMEDLVLLASDKIKIGGLLGYRYERLDFDMYDIFNVLTGQTSQQGIKVLTYKIANRIPYFGIGINVERKKFEIDIVAKYSFIPTSWDVDNHLLRGLTFYADYDRHGRSTIGTIKGFWKFAKNWKFKLGADIAYTKINGSTWEELRDPGWDKDQSTLTTYAMFWSGIEYKF